MQVKWLLLNLYNIMTNTITIDAEGKVLGRVASVVAKALSGKGSPEYARNIEPTIRVNIINVGKTKMTEKRMQETLHERYSGYPGGLTKSTNANIVSKKGFTELYKLAIYNMLPNNKLRPLAMKRLTITE
jgi:large subunit ribosomal protein L13